MCRKKLIIAAMLILSLSLTGCMPFKELKNESIVEGVGIDSGPNGYTVTFQIYKPEKGGGDEGKKGGSSKVTILQSSGSSLFDAVRSASLQNGRKMYFSNTRAYVIGEDVCRDNFVRLLDFMQRNEQIRPTNHLYVAKGKAADVMTYKKNDEIVPAVNLELMSQNYVETSKTVDVQLLDIFKNVSNGITDPTAAAVSVKDEFTKKTLEMDGTAVFRDNRLVGYLDAEKTRGLLWVTGKAKGGAVMLSLPNGASACTEVLKSSSSIDIAGDEKKPVIKVNIKLDTNLTEVQSGVSYPIDKKFLLQLKQIQDKKITAEAKSAVDEALKGYGADIFGFGLKIYRDKPELWRKIGANWNKQLENLKVDISVDSNITHTGLTTQTAFAGKSAFSGIALLNSAAKTIFNQ